MWKVGMTLSLLLAFADQVPRPVSLCLLCAMSGADLDAGLTLVPPCPERPCASCYEEYCCAIFA
eukprot:3373357-Rhodomonas_salina.1